MSGFYGTRYVNAEQTSSVSEFIAFIKERERIRKRKEAGKPWPWTNDPVLRKYHFCNIDRAHDKVTHDVMQFLKRAPSSEALVFNAIVARFFNSPAVLAELSPIEPAEYDWRALYRTLRRLMKRDGLVWRRAYLTVAWFNGIDTGDKMKNYAVVLRELARWCESNAQTLLAQPTIHDGVRMLTKLKGFKEFMGTQVCLDLALTGKARFKTTDYVPLPYDKGSRWGLSDIFGFAEYDRAVEQLTMLKNKTRLTYAQTEQALCEFSRYRRLSDGRVPDGKARKYAGKRD